MVYRHTSESKTSSQLITSNKSRALQTCRQCRERRCACSRGLPCETNFLIIYITFQNHAQISDTEEVFLGDGSQRYTMHLARTSNTL